MGLLLIGSASGFVFILASFATAAKIERGELWTGIGMLAALNFAVLVFVLAGTNLS